MAGRDGVDDPVRFNRLLLFDGQLQERSRVGAGVVLILPTLEARGNVGLVGKVGGESGTGPVGGGKVVGCLGIDQQVGVIGPYHRGHGNIGS